MAGVAPGHDRAVGAHRREGLPPTAAEDPRARVAGNGDQLVAVTQAQLPDRGGRGEDLPARGHEAAAPGPQGRTPARRHLPQPRVVAHLHARHNRAIQGAQPQQRHQG
eukprot:CAMPEP_0179145486 /NCGR_PEP_ID=MMETSP0796-20121207/70194_1 /TAXON_ID=73915 /ORGANISM="Pyrodinium bahamense, Strain pbaha01" /LENGTH=107 /DNA_ID=CAMNT_0020845877 /DNA_START=13 /DNA_END=332 /DNA_ORIENTATION=-